MRLKVLKKFVIFMDAILVRVAQSWFKCFQFGHFDVEDAPRSGRTIIGKVDEIMKKVEQDRHISSHDIDKEINIDHKTVLNYLEKDWYRKNSMLGATWFNSEKFTRLNFHLRIITKMEWNKIEPFFKRLITGDEK